ncbi:hypothetical protein BDK92_4280 [Micromonospora pisi]|uniref:Uncharacterized protein n=1 Tax=Micromonospora pisi TaxID=589240 RepID=A0A495JLI8_9ACTN|nr:hypothetical protein [Micromonospora pisi]RKR89920.1 hypothetical protein BDK92_4280 [Micromonospora pisi]
MSEDRTDQPERLRVDVPYHPVGYELDNVGRAQVPSDLVAGPNEAGVKTEWDASSLDSAIRWLDAHATYLNRLRHEMTDLQDMMGGAAAAGEGGRGPLGGFVWANRLAAQHKSVYDGMEQGIHSLATNLEEAVAALRQVKENYETAEEVNRMTAIDMQKIFADVARGAQSQ